MELPNTCVGNLCITPHVFLIVMSNSCTGYDRGDGRDLDAPGKFHQQLVSMEHSSIASCDQSCSSEPRNFLKLEVSIRSAEARMIGLTRLSMTESTENIENGDLSH